MTEIILYVVYPRGPQDAKSSHQDPPIKNLSYPLLAAQYKHQQPREHKWSEHTQGSIVLQK